MYESMLAIHSWLRWAVLVFLVVYFLKVLAGSLLSRTWSDRDEIFPWIFEQIFGIQVLMGLILWIGLSPFTKEGLRDLSQLFANPLVFFWALRHPLSMLAAFGLWRIARLKCKKTAPEKRYRMEALFMGLLAVIVCSAIPWHWLSYGRPLWRSLF